MTKFKNHQRPRRKYRFDIVGHKKALKIWWDSPFKLYGIHIARPLTELCCENCGQERHLLFYLDQSKLIHKKRQLSELERVELASRGHETRGSLTPPPSPPPPLKSAYMAFVSLVIRRQASKFYIFKLHRRSWWRAHPHIDHLQFFL